MTKEEKASQKIALILLKFADEESMGVVANEGKDMALRAYRGWWELPGRPHFNSLMQKLRRKMK